MFYWLNILLLCIMGLFFLLSFSKWIFPQYLYYYALTVIFLLIINKIDFEVFTLFSKHLYILGIFLLILSYIIGQVTRGTVRWIPIGQLSFQPSEIVRPIIYLYIAKLLTENPLNYKKLIWVILLIFLPIVLIFLQPSLGVSFITLIGFFGVILSSGISKRKILGVFLVLLAIIPLLWVVLKPYQKDRLTTFINPLKDPLGSGYNSIQAVISMGSGSVTGRGFGKGVQTQLKFLPEKYSDFIYASIGEEFGFLGTALITVLFFSLFWQLALIIENPINPTARAYSTGIFFSLLAEVFIHMGMNIGIFPVTGIPLILISAGGSSFLSTIISFAIVIKCKRNINL